MGWFDTQTTIQVASTTYSLAGDQADQINYLKTNLFSDIMGGNRDTYLGESIVRSHLRGPGIDQRRFFNWCKTNTFPGLPVFSISNSYPITGDDLDIVKTEIGVIESLDLNLVTVVITNAFITDADYGYFSEEYMVENEYALLNSDWISEYNSTTQEITITLEPVDPDPPVEIILDVSLTFDVNEQYLVVYYTEDTVPKMLLYQIGTTNANLDALADTPAAFITNEFYPFFPIRLNNVSITDTSYVSNGLFAETETAYERMFKGGTFQDIIDSVEDNENLSQIDYSYVVFGVPLNIKDNSSRRYLYEFFLNMIDLQVSGETTVRMNTIDARLTNFDMRISWNNIEEDIVVGLGKVGAKAGEVWLEISTGEDIIIYNQVDNLFYRKLTITSLYHRNYIYGGSYVNINAHDALNDADLSGFLVPLHNPTITGMSIIHTTQMATAANTFIIFNSYQTYKQKWYETTTFKILVVVAIIIVSVLTLNPAVAGAQIGILGTNLAVGTALGLTGTAAIVAGAVANALAAIVISNLITRGATTLFGDTTGELIGAILSFIVLTAATGGFAALEFANLANAENILQLANVLANTYNGWLQDNIMDINERMARNTESYEDSLSEIEKRQEELFGTNNLSFGLFQFNNISNDNDGFNEASYLPESFRQFSDRTLMTGSEVVDITLSMVNDYSTLMLELPRN